MKRIISSTNNYILASLPLSLLLLPVYAEANITYEVKSFIKFTSVEDLLIAILNIFIVVATPIIVLFIIYAGFLYVSARGNAQQIQQATRALTYAIIGGVLVIGAVALAQVIANTIKPFIAP